MPEQSYNEIRTMLKSAINRVNKTLNAPEEHYLANEMQNAKCKCLYFICSKCDEREKLDKTPTYLRECPQSFIYFDSQMNKCKMCFK
jgi:AAA15 family ATPase/GTPase